MKYSRILTGDVRTFLTSDSEESNFIKKYVLTNLDKKNKSVALCFRGNSGNGEATLYYRCHQLLNLSASYHRIRGKFNFRHAIFSENYRERMEELKELGVTFPDLSNGRIDTMKIIDVTFPLSELGEDRLARILKIYKELIDDFSDPAKDTHMFAVPSRKSGRHQNIEKDSQQEIYAAHFLKDDLMYYDLEYSQQEGRYTNNSFRFDLLGLRRDEDGYIVLLTELKSDKGALVGRADVEKHKNDFIKYLAYSDGAYIAPRLNEAYEAATLFYDIFGKERPKELTRESVKNIKGKVIFSENVIEYGKTYPLPDTIEKVYFKDGKEYPY